MKQFIFFLALLGLLTLRVSAFYDNFYLQDLKDAEKLLPEKLVITLEEGESENISVDILPYGARCDINWKISPAIATIVPSNNKCRIKAITAGDAVLTAFSDSGLTCDIKIKVIPSETKIFLQSNDTVEAGKSTVIYARPQDNSTVSWRVEGLDSSHISFGGNICKINPPTSGTVTVFATSGNTTASKTLSILPSTNSELDLTHLGLIFAVIGLLLLAIVLIYGRGYEKKY